MDKKMERRKNMIQAAKKLFAEHGFEKTTMQKIADEANLGVATLFRYFPKKEHLMIEVIKEVIEQQVPYFEKIIHSNKSGIEKIDDVLTTYIKYISEENSVSTKLLEAFELYIAFMPIEAGLLEEINKEYGKIRNIINAIVQQGKHDGSIQLSASNELATSTLLNLFGTSVKKYSLYTILPEDVIVPVPKREELITVKNMLLSFLQQGKS
ncbi:TetR family transcriptional regulator [Paenibacillus montaniterrae]|uniref:TetR family transcriptional regulator n=1 Tax=Paenibacillus montaniterrae TaxID=429341 RepID=A0A920CYH9_9BACL|nr:TetR/AcrR family transcriptional regulator [Paenibacillus montaniterrae]GIP17420.1 TetR family transcriptional regulator [Paenibacillus montaniterrae]